MVSFSSLSKVRAFPCTSRGSLFKDFFFLRNFNTAVEHATDRGDTDLYPPRYGLHPSGFRPDFESDSRGASSESSGNDLSRSSTSGGNGNWVSGAGGDRLAVDSQYSRGSGSFPRDDSFRISKDGNGFGRRSGVMDKGDCSGNLGRSSGDFQGNADGISGYYGNGVWSPPKNLSHVEGSDRGESLHYGLPGDHYSPNRPYMEEGGKERPDTNRLSLQGPSSSVASSAADNMQSVGGLENILNRSKHVAGVGHNPPSLFAAEYQTSVKGSPDTVWPVIPKDELDKDSTKAPLISALEELDAFCKDGEVKQAVEVLTLLANKYVPVDLPRLVCVMKLCSDKKALQEAKSVHEYVSQVMFPVSVYICNRILEMYMGCGSVDDARTLFNGMAERNLTTWDIMITCLVQNGHGEDAIDLFTQFKQAGLKPDGQLFSSVFSACVAVGDVFEGMLHFESMQKEFGIAPDMGHFKSVVEMLGSVGHLDEAFEFVVNMPIEPNIEIWEVLMSLCRVHGYIDMGDQCADLIEQLDSSCLTMQSRSGLLPVKQSGVAEGEPQQSSANQNLTEVKRATHEYRAGDKSHPESDNIYALLGGLKESMKEAGYIPETKFVLHDVDQESREEAILAHSEKLAISYAIMTSKARSSIRIMKNLRVCVDCHNVFKLISKITGRFIIMRDTKRFHHFSDGECSCREFW